MNKFMARIYLLILLFCPWAFGADKPDQPNPEIEKALKVSDIRHSKMPSFQLSATITLTPENKEPVEGKYVFMKRSDGNWREELTLPGYNRLRVGDDHNYWQVRSQNHDPQPIQNVDDLVDFGRILNLAKRSKFTKPEKFMKDGAVLSCQRSKDDPAHVETICFDPATGALAYRENGMYGFQSPGKISSAKFYDFQEIAGKRFPTIIEGRSGRSLLVDILVKELKEAPAPEAGLFALPAGASQWLACPVPVSAKLSNRVQPAYPESSRQHHEQGIVTFVAVIGVDGTISQLFLIQSAGPELDKSATAAVSQWKYTPPLCDGVPAPVETTIDVIFTLEE
jgi:TonB family protein